MKPSAVVLAAQLEAGDADREVEAGLRLQAERLQRKACRSSPPTRVGAGADRRVISALAPTYSPASAP